MLKLRELFEDSLTAKLKHDVGSSIDKVQSIAREYAQEGKVENARAFIDAHANLTRVLMKTLASVCRDNDESGKTAHRKLATVMAKFYETDSSQFESMAQQILSIGSEMTEMMKNRAAAGREAEAAASGLMGSKGSKGSV